MPLEDIVAANGNRLIFGDYQSQTRSWYVTTLRLDSPSVISIKWEPGHS
jgi:hypothetical protein